MMNIYFYDTDIGKIGIVDSDGFISNLYFETDDIPGDIEIKETELLVKAGRQLLEYFAGVRMIFDLELAPTGTEFQKRVWKALCCIPYGKTASYREIAENISNNKACRAVGMANNKNPIPIFIPCHRVIGSSGKLVGFRGGLKAKEHLLKLENRHF